MKIAEVSEQFGLSVDTLRYYERVGLIPPVIETKVAFETMMSSISGGSISSSA